MRFQKYFSMVGELNVWWPATRVSLWFSRAILPCGGRLRFTCWLKWRETLVVGVCSLFCVLSRATDLLSSRNNARESVVHSCFPSPCSIKFNPSSICSYKLGILSSKTYTVCTYRFLFFGSFFACFVRLARV